MIDQNKIINEINSLRSEDNAAVIEVALGQVALIAMCAARMPDSCCFHPNTPLSISLCAKPRIILDWVSEDSSTKDVYSKDFESSHCRFDLSLESSEFWAFRKVQDPAAASLSEQLDVESSFRTASLARDIDLIKICFNWLEPEKASTVSS